jgi:hypothetical protein
MITLINNSCDFGSSISELPENSYGGYTNGLSDNAKAVVAARRAVRKILKTA